MVSVIIPNYNHAQFLQQRIDTVLAQTYQDFEIILLDDCSTDSSKEIIEQYRFHPKVNHIVYNEVNSGSTFKQWRKGIELCRGEWIWLAESDDYAHSELLSEIIGRTILREDIVISYCQSNEVDETSSKLRTMQWWTDDVDKEHWARDYISEGYDEIRDYLIFKNTIPNASAIIFKKEAYQQVNDDHIKMKYCGDWLLWIQLLRKGKVSYCATPLNFFRKHAATSRTMDVPEKLRKRLEEEYFMLNYIKANFGINSIDFQKRLRFIIALYSSSFTKKEIANSCFKFNYNGQIPFQKILIYKFNKLFSGVK
jgi:glycosyltransferase involved in cell wall biosynthesis